MSDPGSYEHILFAVEDGVATITLNRPEKMNAYHAALGVELATAYERCDKDDAVRAVVLTGAGKAFCAGADMSGGGKTFDDVEGSRRAANKGGSGLAAYQVRKPVVAAINGHAVGVGITLALQCDLRIVASDAKLAFAFVRRGIIPELGSHSILARVIGFSRAADLLLSGRTFLGEEAAELGLASEGGVRSFLERRPPEWKLSASTDLPEWPDEETRK